MLYPNICGGDIGLILELHIIGLKTTKYCAPNCKWKFVCVRQLQGFLVILIFDVFMLRICVLCNRRDFRLAAVLRILPA